MLGASVSRYTRPWIKLLVAKLILTPPQASKLVDTIKKKTRHKIMQHNESVFLVSALAYQQLK